MNENTSQTALDAQQANAERVLSAWLRVTTTVSGERQLSEMRYNEALVCNLLMRHGLDHPDKERLTATDLCRQSNILKSQMNRTLQAMEDRGLIMRERNHTDHRQVLISLSDDCQVFDREHSRVLRLVSNLMDHMGWERADEVVDILNAISDAAEKVLR
jgi:DNA-binding MarR family transcriptional regulator